MTDNLDKSEQLLEIDGQLQSVVFSDRHLSDASMASLERNVAPHCKFKCSDTREGDNVEFNCNMIVTCNEDKPCLKTDTPNGDKPCLENDKCNNSVGYKTISMDNKMFTEHVTDAEINDSRGENKLS